MCIQKDDMQMLYPHLRTADSIVMAAPIYFQGMPAVPKMVIDRCQPFWALKYVLKQPIADPGQPGEAGRLLELRRHEAHARLRGQQRVIRTLW